MGNTLNNNPNTPMVRALGFWSLWAIGVGAVVGDGVFLYSAAGVQIGGPSTTLAFVFAGLIQMAIMLSMCEISVGMPSAGGPTVWVTKYVGRYWGLLSGLAFSIGYMVLGGSVSIALGRIMAFWTPNWDLNFATIFWAVVLFTVFFVMNVFGVEFMGKGQLVLCIILIGIMAIFGIGGVIRGLNMEYFEPFMPYGIAGMTGVIPIATYAFMGASCICFAGEECKKPKDMARALLWSSITFIVVYTLAIVVLLGTVFYRDVTTDIGTFVTAGEIIFGPVGAQIINLAGVIAAGTCILTGCLYMPSRLMYSMSLRGYMPKFLGKLSPRTKVPVRGLVVCWVVGMLGILIAGITEIAGEGYDGVMQFYFFMCNQAVIAWVISWSFSIVAGMKFRLDYGKDRIKNEIDWLQPAFPIIPVIAIAGCAYVLFLSINRPMDIVGLAVWVGIYTIYYLRIRQKVKAGLIDDDISFITQR